MPPKNKGSRNGFFYFMIEYKQKHPECKNMVQASDAAGEFWKNMTADERRPYDIRAKSNKNNLKDEKFNSSGKSIQLTEKEEQERVMEEQAMKEYIGEKIHLAVETNRLEDEPFYVAHVNYFCFCCTDKRYYPAEISVARFTLQDGVLEHNIFHMICQPGSLPLGYLSSAKQQSENTHQIPPPMSDDKDNMAEVANSLCKFIMETNGSGRKFPPLYANKNNRTVVQNVLKNFNYDYGFPELKVYSLEYLFFELRNRCSDEKVWIASSLSELELEKDKYEFCTDIPCPYHIHSDVPNYCSQSCVIRTIYTICDNCCGDLCIDLIPGQHVPKKANVNATRSQSRATTSSSFSSKENSECQYSGKEYGYLSHAESDYSAVSETSTVVDANDFCGASGIDSEFNLTENSEWFPALPKSKNKLDDNTQTSSKQPLRRPNTLSAALAGSPAVGKGRGKGIAANFSNK